MEKVVWNGGEDECWEFEGYLNPGGYGTITVNTAGQIRSVLAHRLAYEHFIGVIPDGLYVCHTCDNPACVNPAHLRAGTAKENTAEAIARERLFESQRGEEARRLYNRGLGYKKIACELGISRDVARDYVNPRRRQAKRGKGKPG